ncbi:MAG: selenoneine synthase SenA [Burkholderiales bacterium]
MTALHQSPLKEWLHDTRHRSLALYADLSGAQLLGSRLSIVNPPLWEIGHIAWFQEYWCLRYRGSELAPLPSMLTHADELYDSAAVAHATRWDLPLPNIDDTQRYAKNVLEQVTERLTHEADNPALRYFAQLAVCHEDMHGEAFFYTRQTLGYSIPSLGATIHAPPGTAWPGDAKISGGRFLLGAMKNDANFVFDNEKWAHEIYVPSFAMAKAAVTYGEFAEFVSEGGYALREFWCDEGWAWRERIQADHPGYWQNRGGQWWLREFDMWVYIGERQHAAVCFVNWFEANAYCRYAQRRLPTEAEWELAAGGLEKRSYPWGQNDTDPGAASRANLDGIMAGSQAVSASPEGDTPEGLRQLWGNVWEWTADSFAPYPGFVRDPYKEYSEPWFGNHKVLRGGCFATRARLLRNTWRNFYTPDRRDIPAGFRTCALYP